MEIQPVAYICSDFDSKFGVPRQSGLAGTHAEIRFEKAFAQPEAVRGLEGFSHLWLIWEFSENRGRPWHPTGRPPRLGGNTRIGLWASRSPFRPNPLGLSCVKLEKIELREETGPVLHVTGADLVNGTPIYDIKPYVPYADCHPDALGGFTQETSFSRLTVTIPEDLARLLPEGKAAELCEILSQDPRPSYQRDKDPGRVYGMDYAGKNVRFVITGSKLLVISISKV